MSTCFLFFGRTNTYGNAKVRQVRFIAITFFIRGLSSYQTGAQIAKVINNL